MNTKFTCFSLVNFHSCIDHLISNCPNHIFNVLTKPILFSDHALLGGILKVKPGMYHARHKLIRNYRNITEFNVNEALLNNPAIETAFQHSDPNVITNVSTLEINKNP